jgi:hypothetical protein
MPKFAVTVNDNGVRKRVVLDSATEPTEADVLSALRGSAQPAGPATIAEMRRREEQGMVAALPPEQVQAAVGSTAQLNQAVQDASNVGQQEGGFMASLKEVFRGLGSGGSGLAGGEVALAPVGDSPEAKRYREAIAFQARTVPVLGAALSTGGLGAIPTALTMAGTSAVAEEAAQEYEKATGLREKREPGKVVGAGVFGATPGLGPIQGASGPLAAGIWQAGKQALLNASTAALSKTVEKAIDEGRLPTVEELEKTIELPAYLGTGTGFLGGALSRGQQPLTTAQQIAQQGREAGQRIEQQVGVGAAPLTGAQQTGINVPGQFREGSAGLAAQQNLVQRIRNVLNLNPQQEQAVGQAVQQEFGAAENVSRQALRQQIQAGQTAVQGEVEGAVRSVIPNAQRAASSEASANNALTAIRQEDQRLGGLVDNAYNTMRTALANRLSGRPEPRVAPTAALGQRIDDLLSTLATEERVTTTPSLIIGGQPTVTVENVPSQFFNEATRRAESLREVARSPQTMEGLVGLRQSIDGLINYFNEFAPGVGQRQLRQLRSALKSEELNAARRLGVESELVAAQNLAEQRFNVLQDNPIIRKAASAAGEGGFQNAETFYSQLASQPEAVASINNLLSTTAQGRIQLNQIRRGLLDSLRSDRPIEIAGQQFENSGSLLNGFRNLPESTQSFIAGNAQNANRLRSILEDANRVQNAGRSIPLGGGISQAALAEITDNLGNINSQRLRQIVTQDAQAARARSEEFFNTTTREVQNNRLNPDVDPSQFVRDFLFRSNNPQVVRDALDQLSIPTRQAARRDAAVALLNHVSETSPRQMREGLTNVEDILRNPNRMQIIRETLDPADFNMINDYMIWTRARNLTREGRALQPNQLADAVKQVSQARLIIDNLVGNPTAQNFLASVSRVPRFIGGLKPNLTAQQAQTLAKNANVPLQNLYRTWDELKQKSNDTRSSLPEEKRQIFDETLAIPNRPQ